MPKRSSLLKSVPLLVITTLISGTDAATQSQIHTLYVSALDKSNIAITDLEFADFEVNVGGRKADVVAAHQAAMPLRLAVIVSDAKTGVFQVSLGKLMQKLHGRAEFELFRMDIGPERLVDYTADSAVLGAALQRIGVRGRPQTGALLMEAIDDAAKEVHPKGTRQVILVLRVGGEANTGLSPDDVRELLSKNGAMLYVISTFGSERIPSQARIGMPTVEVLNTEDIHGALSLSQVLSDGARESGGRHEQIISTTMVTALEDVANELLHQYALRVSVPNGTKPDAKVSVSTRRKDVTVRAPSRLGPSDGS